MDLAEGLAYGKCSVINEAPIHISAPVLWLTCLNCSLSGPFSSEKFLVVKTKTAPRFWLILLSLFLIIGLYLKKKKVK